MIRSLLQFLGFASTTVWATLLLGMALTKPALADGPPVGVIPCPD